MENGIPKLYKRIIAVALGLLAAVYLGYHIINNLRASVTLFTVRPYTARDSATFTGYIFREETVLTSRTSGLCHYPYYNGEKVGAEKIVANVYRYGGANVEDAIADYKKQIEILRRSEALGRLTIEEVGKRIDRLTFIIAEKNAAGDTTAADALSDELLVLMAKRDLLTSGKSNYEAEIVMLENELARIVSALGAPSEYITTPRSGYFYSETDGYEAILTTERAKNMTLKEFDTIISESPIYITNAVGTLVTSAKWYFATKTTEENAEGFITGVIYNCLFIDNGYQETIPLKLVSKETENGDALLIFHSSSLPRDFDITRCQRMEAIKSEYTGLRIPTDVVRVKDGVTYVYILKEGVAREREINILWEQNGYFIISETFEGLSERGNLSLNDLIILDESDLYDGKFIH
jgi:hypothetical protein